MAGLILTGLALADITDSPDILSEGTSISTRGNPCWSSLSLRSDDLDFLELIILFLIF
jgi:hypothetical protein